MSSGVQQAPSECPSSSVASSPLPTVPVTLQSLLELNIAYQDLVQGLINELETILMENHLLQEEAGHILAVQAKNSNNFICRGCRFPYFFNEREKVPPPSEEKLIKERLGVRSLPVAKKWIAKDLIRLQDAVFASVKRSVVFRLLAKRAKLENQLAKGSCPEIQGQIDELTEQLNEVEQMRKIDLLRKYRDSERIDWLCIAVTEFGGRRTDRDLELIWENHVWPSIHFPPWNAEIALKMEQLIRGSSNAPDWESIAAACKKHVMQCWELHLGQKNGTAKQISDDDLKALYYVMRSRDYVPWLAIGKRLNIFSQVRVIRRIESALYKGRVWWRLEDDVLLLLAIYLYRGSCNWSQVVRCMRTPTSALSAGHCLGRLDYLLGVTSLSSAVQYLDAFQPSEGRRHLPGKRCRQTMVPWLVSTLMSLMSKVRISCFYKEDSVSELQRVSLKVSKTIQGLIGSNKQVIALSDRLDHQIGEMLGPKKVMSKPVRFAGGEVIFSLMQSVIEKRILGMDSEPVPSGANRSAKEKRLESVVELEQSLDSGLVTPFNISLSSAQVLLDNVMDAEPLDQTVISWIEEQLENDPAFADFEKHFNAVFALPLFMSKVDVPEVLPTMQFDKAETKQNRKRKDVIFHRKRGAKKHWMKERWERHRQEKLKAQLAETVAENADERCIEGRLEESHSEDGHPSGEEDVSRVFGDDDQDTADAGQSQTPGQCSSDVT